MAWVIHSLCRRRADSVVCLSRKVHTWNLTLVDDQKDVDHYRR